jgi:hypothetical protein
VEAASRCGMSSSARRGPRAVSRIHSGRCPCRSEILIL